MRKIRTTTSFHLPVKSSCYRHHRDQGCAMTAEFMKAGPCPSSTIRLFQSLRHGALRARKPFDGCSAHYANTMSKESRQTLVSLSRFSKDRKSTRLNSSHRTISYAVFCLK